MSFADNYLSKQKKHNIIFNNSSKNERFIIVIPCYNEPFVLNTLHSLNNCIPPKSVIHVIIVVNSSEISTKEVIQQNLKSIFEIKSFAEKANPFFSISIIHEPELPKKYAGAGLARKIGMDESVNMFNKKHNPDGIIISLDADTLVEKNYLTEIENYYNKNKNANGGILYFEHPVKRKGYNQEIYQAIILYELYLRYFIEALRYCEFPYAFHTIGSCFTVKADIYVKSGGMNKQHAGEDFYFLHKIFPHGNFQEINTTCVYPSPRLSERVPFGTGPAIKKIIENNMQFKTFNFNAFTGIKKLIKLHGKLYNSSTPIIKNHLSLLPKDLKEFLELHNFYEEIKRINMNCSTINSFSKHFFNWFSAFRIIKYLNFSHEKYYNKQNIMEVSNKYLCVRNFANNISEPFDVLVFYRESQRKTCYKI